MTHDTDIPQGYKATALEIIPQEWEVMRLGDIVSITSGESPSLYHLKSEGKYPYVKVEDLNNCEKYQESSREYSDDNNTTIKAGSIIFPKRGASILNNKVRIAAKDIQMDSNMMAITPHTAIVDTEFLYIRILYERLYRIADTSSIPQINNKHIIPYKIAVPPLAEQRKIAEVLGVWDEAIEKQARLIEKLALRKRGLMQRLLPAKLRLPGFSDPWKELKINKITIIRKGEQVNKDVLFSNAKYPVINGGITPSGYLDIYNTKANTITISEGGNSCGYVNFMTTPFWSGGHCYTIEAKDGINNLFIYQLLKNNEKYIMSLRVGSGLPNIQIKDLGNLKFMIPTYQEQTAIAEVLTASDREIGLAKERLERLRHQKRGLMQQLLSGKKRITI